MAGFSVNVKGLAEVERRLNQIPDDLAKRVLKVAAKAGGEVFRQEIRGRIHNVSGKMFRGVQNTVKQTGPGEITATVAPAKKLRWIANFLQFGTKAHEVRARSHKTLERFGIFFGPVVHHPGIRAQEFLSKAFEAGKTDALAVFAGDLRDWLAGLGK